MQGWIKLHRRIQSHWIYQEKRVFSKYEAWIDLIIMANHAANKILVDNELINVEKGQLITSIRRLCDKWEWSNTKVVNFLNLLQQDNMINFKSDTKKTEINICNYNLYHDMDTEESDTETTRKHNKNISENRQKSDGNEKNEKIQKNKRQANGTDNAGVSSVRKTDEINKTTRKHNGNTSETFREHTNKNVKECIKNVKEKDYTSKIKNLLTVYSSRIENFNTMNKQYWDIIRETRKTGQISKSVIYNTMKKWKRYDPVVIKYALQAHIDLHAGKREEYTIGIMRNTSKDEAEDRLNKKPIVANFNQPQSAEVIPSWFNERDNPVQEASSRNDESNILQMEQILQKYRRKDVE